MNVNVLRDLKRDLEEWRPVGARGAWPVDGAALVAFDRRLFLALETESEGASIIAAYTNDLTMAARLIPAGVFYVMGRGYLTKGEPEFGCGLYPEGDNGEEQDIGKGEHPHNLPLAVCIARLDFEIRKAEAQ